MSEYQDAVDQVISEFTSGLLTREDAVRKLKFLGMDFREIDKELGPPDEYAE